MISFFDFMPEVTTHAYYCGKRNFMLSEDTYPQWVILAAEEGEFEYMIHDERGVAAFGDLVLCPPNTVLKRKALTMFSYHFILFTWRHLDETKEIITIPSGKIHIQNQERLAENLQLMKNASELTNDRRTKRISQLLFDIWYLYSVESLPNTIGFDQNINDDPLMDKITSLLNEKAFEQVLLKQVAAEVGMSPVQLTRIFFTAFGITPNHYLNTIRIQKAQTLLLETNLNLQQIAEESGYENGFYLSRVFKKKVGVSPSQFRKLNQI